MKKKFGSHSSGSSSPPPPFSSPPRTARRRASPLHRHSQCLSAGVLTASLPAVRMPRRSLPPYRHTRHPATKFAWQKIKWFQPDSLSAGREAASPPAPCVPLCLQQACLSPRLSLPLRWQSHCLHTGTYIAPYVPTYFAPRDNFVREFNTFRSLPLCRHTAPVFACGLFFSRLTAPLGSFVSPGASKHTHGKREAVLRRGRDVGREEHP